MNNLVKIYSINFKNMKLILPTINDVKAIVMENEELFDLLLLNKLRIETNMVAKESKRYKVALKNAILVR